MATGSIALPAEAGAPEVQALRHELEALRARLQEAEDTLTAIRGGEVEALVVQTADGPKVFGLTSADAVVSQRRGEMLAQVLDAVLAVDAEQRVTYLNAAAERHYGCTASAALGRRLRELVTIAWLSPGDEDAARAALATDGAWHGECVHTLPDGRKLTVDVSLSALRDAAGRCHGTLSVARDVSERRRTDDALRRLTGRFEAALQAASIVLFEQDRELRYTWIHNPALGATPEQVVGHTDHDLFERAEDAERLIAVKQAVLADGQPRRVEVDLMHAGQMHCFDMSVQPLRDSAGAVVGVTCSAVDLTERKREERARAELGDRLRLALQAAATGMWDWDVASGAVTWSPECHVIHAIPPGQFGGTADDFFKLVYPDDLERLQAAVREALDTHRLFECEFRILLPDGRARWVANLGRGVYSADGRLLRMIGTIIDISQRKQAEQARRDEAQRKDDFLAMLAHELRNPLAPIRMTVGILRAQASDNPLLARCRDIIDRQSALMARLLDDLLDVSRLAAGKITLRTERVPLKQALDAAIETVRPLVDARSQQLVLQIDEAAALDVDGDAARLTQVFANLLHNAAKYGHAGGRIEMSVAAEADHAVVRVRDDGIGIAPEALPHIFELFVQGGEARQHAPGGLGIGLALASRLVHMHGGVLDARSTGVGQGSEFCVTLPRAGLRDALAAQADGARADAALALLPQRRVLVADDNVDAAETTAMLLQAWGSEVAVVYDGEAAVREAERLRPAVVVLDLGMQGVDGYEACRRIRAQPWGMTMTVVALSGWGREEDQRRSAKAGFDLHLTKPVDAQRLIEAVRVAR